MALPGSSGTVDTYGIKLGWGVNNTDTLGNPVTPSTRVSVASATSGPWSRIAVTVAGATGYTHQLANDGVRRYYRVQHFLFGYTASTWLGIVDAKPAKIVEV